LGCERTGKSANAITTRATRTQAHDRERGRSRRRDAAVNRPAEPGCTQRVSLHIFNAKKLKKDLCFTCCFEKKRYLRHGVFFSKRPIKQAFLEAPTAQCAENLCFTCVLPVVLKNNATGLDAPGVLNASPDAADSQSSIHAHTRGCTHPHAHAHMRTQMPTCTFAAHVGHES